jgi:hypothetical protein
MSYKLFLDDVRNPGDVTWVTLPEGPWVVLRDYHAFCDHIMEHGGPEFVTFDHDLADEHYRPSMYNPDRHYSNYYTDGTFKEKTGFECAKWLVNRCFINKLPFPAYAVHTKNPIGAENIVGIIESYNRFFKENP